MHIISSYASLSRLRCPATAAGAELCSCCCCPFPPKLRLLSRYVVVVAVIWTLESDRVDSSRRAIQYSDHNFPSNFLLLFSPALLSSARLLSRVSLSLLTPRAAKDVPRTEILCSRCVRTIAAAVQASNCARVCTQVCQAVCVDVDLGTREQEMRSEGCGKRNPKSH